MASWVLEWTEVKVADGVNLRLVASASGIRAIEFGLQPVSEYPRNDRNPMLLEAARQLRAYFAGALREFRLPLDLQGTGFQQQVWRQVAAIPYGETRSYLQISTAVGSPRAVRAVGAANGANPVPIVIPCHRVIGANGKLVGYGGGLALKKRLLELEGAIPLSLAL
ncbi:MAG: methylated-DNA--[protein]-cysteine S-methyltransferase [Bryobacteraceae bacterium]